MKTTKRALLVTLFLSLFLFIVGFYIWPVLLEWLLPTDGNTKYLVSDPGYILRSSLWFGLLIALLPVAIFSIWRYAPVLKPAHKFLTVCILLACMALAVLIRRERVKQYSLSPSPIIEVAAPPVSALHFKRYAFGGLVAGSAIAFFSLRQRRVA